MTALRAGEPKGDGFVEVERAPGDDLAGAADHDRLVRASVPASGPCRRLAMTQRHAALRGRLYRYYVCLGASRRGHDTCPVRSIAASEVESLLLGQVRRLLASPELVARTITAVRQENGAAQGPRLDESEVIEAPGALKPVWDELYPAEQARDSAAADRAHRCRARRHLGHAWSRSW
jgi:hypothetical protein